MRLEQRPASGRPIVYERPSPTAPQRPLADYTGTSSEHGQKYEIHDIIRGPTGREAHIVTVWIILSGEDFPRLVTAYPGDAP